MRGIFPMRLAHRGMHRHILTAARRLVMLDEKQIDAVAARIELDLRIGYAFTRWLTTSLRQLGGPLQERMISYGMCASNAIHAWP